MSKAGSIVENDTDPSDPDYLIKDTEITDIGLGNVTNASSEQTKSNDKKTELKMRNPRA